MSSWDVPGTSLGRMSASSPTLPRNPSWPDDAYRELHDRAARDVPRPLTRHEEADLLAWAEEQVRVDWRRRGGMALGEGA